MYVLAFQPQVGDEPGEYRKLRVELRSPLKGAKILHRPGYYAARPPSKGDVFQRRMDGVGWLMTNLEAADMGVDVYAAIETDSADGTRVPVVVEIAGESLRALRTKKATRLELQLAVLDEESQVREILNGEIKLRFADMGGALSGGGVRFVGTLGLSPGDYQMRVLVRSSRKGEVYLGTFPLAVGAGAEATLPPPPPLAERQGESWLTVETESRTAYFQ